MRSHCRSELAATTATESGETEQGQGTGSRNVAHGEGSVGLVHGTTGVEVAGAGVGPGGAFSEGELGDEDRGAFDGGPYCLGSSSQSTSTELSKAFFTV